MTILIRRIAAPEIEAVAERMSRHPNLVRARLELQEQGGGHYLIAWEQDDPVGQLVLRWEREVPAPKGLSGIPYIEDVYVPHDHRGQGIGSQLIAEAERCAAASGHQQVTLAVNTDNIGAQRLYRRHGYADAGIGTHLQPWFHYDRLGHLHEHQERVLDYVKRVTANRA
ncbi:MAG: hypothetical protein NVS3B18_00680 [Candidatus Dormibacteria bacterium]